MTDLHQFLKSSSKKNVLALCNLMQNDKNVFTQIMDIALSGKQPESKRAVWTLDTFFDRKPEYFIPYYTAIIQKLPEFKEERNQGSFLRMFSRVEFVADSDEDNFGLLFDFCIQILKSDKIQMYMKHYALQVLKNLGKQFPELTQEICTVIEENTNRFDREHLRNMGKQIIIDLSNPNLK